MNPALLKPALMSLAALTAAVSLASCAPAAGDSSTRSSTTPVPRYPFKTGTTWTISGTDQNFNKIEGKITLVDEDPLYRDNSGRGSWFYDADNGYIALYELERSTRFVVWDVSESKRLVACYLGGSYDSNQTRYEGVSLAGSADEINGLFAKLGNGVLGGSCVVTRS
ncbi:hypothetical protein ACFP9V_10795 [Deinococcus radiopugnans]|uniref:Lipoprotein n=1 Tax=Deinococcus radiopugnans ATCC 19172 TaxID=585398 RepID=A0A5C4XXY0_9DEIO|nr:hypothetical protein [Deinococcus radiopugnans]MBB6018329.1 hypothetical protein [Deinococcus radiopugnans ATCC 19172]TNM67983.1 hypothetical protein FHR04_17605 [Deinococcus radiopugnans ATCC 19172]